MCVLPFVGHFPSLGTPVRMEHSGRLSRNSVFRQDSLYVIYNLMRETEVKAFSG